MQTATEIRVGNMLKLEGRFCKVISQELKGTGKFGKTVHLKLRHLDDGHMIEKSFRVEEKVDVAELHRTKMQYLYRDETQFVFMNMDSYEQFSLSEKAVGRQAVFLKEGMEIDIEFVEGKPVSVGFPPIVELLVSNTPPPMKGGSDSTRKEAELENGLTVLVPHFVKQGEKIRVDTETFAYLDRVTTKSLKTETVKPEE